MYTCVCVSVCIQCGCVLVWFVCGAVHGSLVPRILPSILLHIKTWGGTGNEASVWCTCVGGGGGVQ